MSDFGCCVVKEQTLISQYWTPLFCHSTGKYIAIIKVTIYSSILDVIALGPK